MVRAAFKLPVRWTAPGLTDRTALYPALYLRWAGHRAALGRSLPAGQWTAAELRVLVADGVLAEDERELMALTAARGQPMVLATQAPLPEADLAWICSLGVPLVAWRDAGPLSSPAPHRPGLRRIEMAGCAARAAEDLILLRELTGETPPARASGPAGEGPVVAAAESAAAFREVWPALERQAAGGRGLVVTSESEAALFEIADMTGASTLSPSDPALLSVIAEAAAFLCLYPEAAADSPRPGQWVRSALYAGAPVIAASHPSIDGLAHLVVLDDFERGLKLYRRFPIERLKATVAAQAELAPRLEPDRIAEAWAGLAAPARPTRRPAGKPAPEGRPRLLVLIDIHQDLDVLLPVLVAISQREEMRLSIAVTDWLLAESPRVLNLLHAYGFEAEVYTREEVRAGRQPPLGGVDGVLSGAETNVRAHKSGHTLAARARERGAASFTVQHGLENIGLTYRDELHTEAVRFSSDVVFTWGPLEGLAPWAAPETRAAAVPVGSPKTAPPPARAQPLHQGRWARSIGVFENLHWARFSDAYRRRLLADLQAIAEAEADTLFLVKPHHAGRWMSRHRELVGERDNLVVVDPTDSAWEPHTAPALIAAVDAVLTTPSTVAMDAARTGRPVAVLGYDLELPLYEPLPIVRSLTDLQRFLGDESGAHLLRNEAFLKRARVPGRADHRIAARIATTLRERRAARRAGERALSRR